MYDSTTTRVRIGYDALTTEDSRPGGEVVVRTLWQAARLYSSGAAKTNRRHVGAASATHKTVSILFRKEVAISSSTNALISGRVFLYATHTLDSISSISITSYNRCARVTPLRPLILTTRDLVSSRSPTVVPMILVSLLSLRRRDDGSPNLNGIDVVKV